MPKDVRLARYMLRECKVAEPEEAQDLRTVPGVVRSEQNSGGSLANKPKISRRRFREEPATRRRKRAGW
jgi:hypothetical protein